MPDVHTQGEGCSAYALHDMWLPIRVYVFTYIRHEDSNVRCPRRDAASAHVVLLSTPVRILVRTLR